MHSLNTMYGEGIFLIERIQTLSDKAFRKKDNNNLPLQKYSNPSSTAKRKMNI
jgi:hypothetical protein